MSAERHDPTGDSLDGRTRRVLQAAQAGERAGLLELCERLAPALHAWTHLRMGVKLRGRLDPGEVVQEVWCRALSKIADLDPETPLRPWLFRIAQFVLIEAVRRLPTTPPGTSLFAPLDPTDPATSVLSGIARRDALDRFLRDAESLRPDDRELLVLHGLEGRPLGEVAERLDVRYEAAVKRWQRLRTRLAGDGPPDYLL